MWAVNSGFQGAPVQNCAHKVLRYETRMERGGQAIDFQICLYYRWLEKLMGAKKDLCRNSARTGVVSELLRNNLRHARLLHGYAIHYWRHSHGLLAVGDDDELRGHGHLANEFGE